MEHADSVARDGVAEYFESLRRLGQRTVNGLRGLAFQLSRLIRLGHVGAEEPAVEIVHAGSGIDAEFRAPTGA